MEEIWFYYLEQILFTCPEDDRTSTKCTNSAFLKNWLGSTDKIYYSIIYPQAFFAPTGDSSNPLQVSYVDNIQMLSSNLYKKNRYFFTQSELEIDNGWIFTDKFTSNAITYNSNDFDIDERPDLDQTNMQLSSNIYATTIYFMKNHDKYSMSYMKIQD